MFARPPASSSATTSWGHVCSTNPPDVRDIFHQLRLRMWLPPPPKWPRTRPGGAPTTNTHRITAFYWLVHHSVFSNWRFISLSKSINASLNICISSRVTSAFLLIKNNMQKQTIINNNDRWWRWWWYALLIIQCSFSIKLASSDRRLIWPFKTFTHLTPPAIVQVVKYHENDFT